MNEAEIISKIITSLRKVPSKQLLIIDLVNRYWRPDKKELDYEGLTDAEPEVNAAIAEAKMYGAHTIRMVDSLRRLKARPDDVG